MATSNRRACCFTCGKEKGGVRCEGCSKIFCLNHFNDHRQELNKELDEVEVNRDLFRQSLTEKISEAQNHVLIQQVNDWENQSINKIRQAADEAREILRKHTAGVNTQLEDRLKKLTDQLRQNRQENEFVELDINQWKDELIQMKNELVKPSNVTIRQDPTALVTRITIGISSDRHNVKSPRTRQKTIKNTDNQERNVHCSLFDEEFPSPNDMIEHFVICGNTASQCPKCRKYVPPAIRAYHFKNDCKNPDDLMTNNESLENSQYVDGSRSTNEPHIPCEWCNKGILWLHYDDHTRTCREEYQRQQKQSRPNNQTRTFATGAAPSQAITPATGWCIHCGTERSMEGLAYHQMCCKNNPRKRGML